MIEKVAREQNQHNTNRENGYIGNEFESEKNKDTRIKTERKISVWQKIYLKRNT